MKKLPDLIRVNGRDFTIKHRAASRMPDALGLCHLDTHLIELRRGQSPVELRDTLLHETFHALLHTQGREYGGEVEEQYVRAIATGLIGVLRDNPWMAEWLSTSETE